jgi:hypothetical protein
LPEDWVRFAAFGFGQNCSSPPVKPNPNHHEKNKGSSDEEQKDMTLHPYLSPLSFMVVEFHFRIVSSKYLFLVVSHIESYSMLCIPLLD